MKSRKVLTLTFIAAGMLNLTSAHQVALAQQQSQPQGGQPATNQNCQECAQRQNAPRIFGSPFYDLWGIPIWPRAIHVHRRPASSPQGGGTAGPPAGGAGVGPIGGRDFPFSGGTPGGMGAGQGGQGTAEAGGGSAGQPPRPEPPRGPDVPTYDPRFYKYRDGRLVPRPNAPNRSGQAGGQDDHSGCDRPERFECGQHYLWWLRNHEHRSRKSSQRQSSTDRQGYVQPGYRLSDPVLIEIAPMNLSGSSSLPTSSSMPQSFFDPSAAPFESGQTQEDTVVSRQNLSMVRSVPAGAQGGTFTAVIPVAPRFTFTDVQVKPKPALTAPSFFDPNINQCRAGN